MKEVMLTTIIPAYNCEKYISKTLESILKQNISEHEIIIIDDCSQDNTIDICKKFANQYENIKLVRLDENKGVSNARNIGISMSNSKYIHFMDSDDTINENMYSELIKNAEENNIELITCGFNILDNKNRVVERRNNNKSVLCTSKLEIGKFLSEFNETTKNRVLNVIWNKLYLLEIIKKNNLTFDTKVSLGEDFMFNCTYLKKINSMLELENCCYNYLKRNSDNLTSKFRNDVIERRNKVYNSWISLYKSYNILNEDNLNFINYIEGKLMYYTMYTIFSYDCKLNKSEKLNFIKEIVFGKHISFVKDYLKNGIEYILIKRKNINLLYYFIKIKSIIINLKRKIKNIKRM